MMDERRQRSAATDGGDEAVVLRYLREPDGAEARRELTVLFGRHRRNVYRWCHRLVRDHELAMDLAQEVLLAAFRDLSSFGGRARFSSWLFAITRNRCLSHLRRPSLVRDDDLDPDSLVDEASRPDRELEEKLDESAVLELIRRTLEPVEQDAIWLRCIERRSVDDITQMLDITSASGARGVLQAARRKLQRALEPRVER